LEPLSRLGGIHATARKLQDALRVEAATRNNRVIEDLVELVDKGTMSGCSSRRLIDGLK
jgi:hypothetical protein